MKTYAVIVAGGSGTRMGTEMPKQFLRIHGIPVFIYSIKAFLRAIPDISVLLVLPADHQNNGMDMIHEFLPASVVKIVVGGTTRFESVRNGLQYVEKDSIVFIHDAVRCMVTGSLIAKCYDDAVQYGSAIPVVAVRDSIRRIRDDGSEVLDRGSLRAVQTPQTFRSEIILAAFTLDYQPAFTDEATVVEYFGGKVHLTEGEESNIKITYPTDLQLAEKILAVG